jgi:hypothetical protein
MTLKNRFHLRDSRLQVALYRKKGDFPLDQIGDNLFLENLPVLLP